MSRTTAALTNAVRPDALHDVIAIYPPHGSPPVRRFTILGAARGLRTIEPRSNSSRFPFDHHGSGAEIFRGFAISGSIDKRGA
jgi:hypothetical protein